ncbi:leucine-rich repeat and IQ domain-containing protein 3 isoform X2 [Electrophorus electricus]|nr:leucine-rich repeat and IQ domain-containing protein 3 isoform X2 [Electrophorus electricus]
MVSKKNITGLSGCPRLSALTLYDTPLSLKVSYRHCVINSIWTLKALDNHVISDEEIMEDWHLPSKFRAKAPQFCVNLYPQLKLDSYKNEIKVVHGIMAEINRIQAIYSPVLIIQKWIRGHLTRRRLGRCGCVLPWRSLVRKLISASTPASPPSLGIARRSWIQEHQDGQLHQGQKGGDVTIKKLHMNLSEVVPAESQEILQDTLSARSFDSLTVPCNTPQQGTGARSWRTSSDLDAKAMDSESFCLFGLKATMHLSKPFADMLMSRKADGQDVRDAIGHLHKLKAHAPSLRQPRPPNITAEKRLVDQRSNCLSLAPFWEIERAYRAREKAEDLRARVERVVQAQALRADACSRHDAFGMSRRKEALEQRERERMEAAEAMSLRRAQREQEVQRVRQRHARFLEEKRRKASERETVELFCRQHVSLATAVARHCTRQNLRHALHERRQRVASIKQHTTAGGPDTPGQQETAYPYRGCSVSGKFALLFSKSAPIPPKAGGQRGMCELQTGRTLSHSSARLPHLSHSRPNLTVVHLKYLNQQR